MNPRLCPSLLAVAVFTAACTHRTAAPAPFRSPIGRLCVGPAGLKFDPRAPIALAPVPRIPTAWWTDAAVVVFANGCHSTSETLLGVPRLSRLDVFSWEVDGAFTATVPSHGPVLPDCGAGHFAYRVGRIEPGHHEFRAAGAILGVDVPAADAPLSTSPTVSDWSCIDVPVGTPTGPSIPPDEIVQRSTPSAKPSPPASLSAPPSPVPLSGTVNPAPSDWCTYENDYACPAGFNCCAAGPRHPGQAAPCTLPRRDTKPGTNVCR